MKMKNDIFNEGCLAYIRYTPINDCPYTDPELRNLWEDGWCYEREMAEYERYMDHSFKVAGLK